mgnify:CR=1 FL=1
MAMNDSLPPPLMTSEPGSFARLTIVERKPQIIQQVIEDNDYPGEIVAALEAFREEIAQHPVRPLTEAASDALFWNQETAAYEGKTWLELPWYLAETYFYRRVLEAVRYLGPGPWQGHDPFGPAKRRVEQEAVTWLAENWGPIDSDEPRVSLEVLLHSFLWGNRADLSNFTVREQAHGGLATRQERQHLLIDHTDRAAALLLAGAHFLRKGERKIGYLDAFIIGLAQAIAVIPGISRSGSFSFFVFFSTVFMYRIMLTTLLKISNAS